jgi:hypothetical protein
MSAEDLKEPLIDSEAGKDGKFGVNQKQLM